MRPPALLYCTFVAAEKFRGLAPPGGQPKPAVPTSLNYSSNDPLLKLLAEGGKLLLHVAEFLTQARHFFLQACETLCRRSNHRYRSILRG